MPCSVSSSSKTFSRALKALGIGFIVLIVFGSILKAVSPEKPEADNVTKTERQSQQK